MEFLLLIITDLLALLLGFPSVSVVKNPPAKQEIPVRSLGRKDPLEEGIATHFSILAWKTPWTACWATAHWVSCKESDMTVMTEHAWTALFFLTMIVTILRVIILLVLVRILFLLLYSFLLSHTSSLSLSPPNTWVWINAKILFIATKL